MKKFAVIVAGGIGTRMQSELPKQFLEIHSTPIIIHTINKFLGICDQIILVLPKEFIEYWQTLQERYFPNTTIIVTAGGSTRTQSVKNGLLQINEQEGLVAIHDAARPFVSRQHINQCYTAAQETGSGVLAVPLKDSIRKLEANGSVQCDRSQYMLVQTPQTFQLSILRNAYKEVLGEFTDDASLVEANGHIVTLVVGTYENIKITTPEDLILGEAILKFQSSNS